MKYRKLGRTGFEVSDIAHGLWGMGDWSGSDDQDSLAALQLATYLGATSLIPHGPMAKEIATDYSEKFYLATQSHPIPPNAYMRRPRSRP